MGLSSNTLVHLTRQKDSLIGIIQEGFKLKYCAENVRTSKGTISGAFPMVSFSDIPLSELKNHITSYGNFGIGLKKDWAKRNKLNPVLYFDNSSKVSGLMNEDFGVLAKLAKKGEIPKNIFESLIHISSYAKNYEGTLETEKVKIENYRFSDEREWRYVPINEELDGCKSWITPSDYDTQEKKDNVNSELNKIHLTFNPDDINYLFVEHEAEIQEFIEIIRKTFKKNAFDSVDRLISRIITTSQIMTDI